MRNLGGRDFILYGGVLQLARERGLKRITTTIVQTPSKDNGYYAVCEAEVETSDGVFRDVGDASPESVSRTIQPHLLRMAATRAKARAMRDAVGIDMVALEELGGDSENDEEVSDAAVRAVEMEASEKSITLGFGKYAGKPLEEIWNVDPGYVEWLAKNAHEESVRAAASGFSRNLV